MKLNENSDEIAIRYVPISQWIIGGTLTLVCLGLGFWILHIDLIGSWPSIVVPIAIILFVISEVGGFLMILAPLTAITLSRQTNSVSILRKRIYGGKEKRYYFFQVKKFKSYKKHGKFSSKYFLALVLANQNVIKLKIPLGTKEETIKLVKKLNKFIKSKKLSEVDIRRNSFKGSRISA